MKYVITERQYNIIREISRESGHFDFDPLDSFFEYMDEQIHKKQKVKLFKEFFRKKMGFGVEEDEFLVSDILGYFESPTRSEWGDIFKSKDARSGFAHFVAKKYFGLKEKFGLSYLINKLSDNETFIYYFFDPTFKIFVGRFVIGKSQRKKMYKVQLSAADEELIGTGYGTKMYLIIIDDVDYLSSDTILYSGSYRIWKHVLPKYVNVWGVIDNDYGLPTTIIKMDEKGKKSVKRFDYFFASSKHNKL
jgi:hypothetical protein